MDTIECVKTRLSVRRFKPEPVSKNMLFEIIDAARHSPSYKNSQPWEIIIVSGKKKEELSKLLIEIFEKGIEAEPDMPEPKTWPSDIEARIQDNLNKRGLKLGIDLNSPEVRKKAKILNFKFYNAPHGIFIFQDASLTQWSIMDAGMFAQSLMLAAHAKGLGTVPQAFLTDYSKQIKKFLAIPDSKRLLLGISIGYPQVLDASKIFTSERIDANKFSRWIE
ncbi:MAG: nitroreductase [Nitrospiraceae bacterium]|nr:nitroreductase [Nitrospiraceae bacterium]